jgi:PAS domain S-box-containing protein
MTKLSSITHSSFPGTDSALMKTGIGSMAPAEQSVGYHRLQTLLDFPPEFIDLLPVAAYACDASGRVLWFNKRAVDLWGRTPRIGDDTELFCGSYRLYFDGRQIGRAETPMAVALRSGDAIHGVEGIVERPDGSRIWTTVHIDPVKNVAGEFIGAINCFSDTTELHEARAALAEREAHTRRLLEALPAAVYTTDAVGRITYYNKAAADLAGREPTLGSDEWCDTWKRYCPDGTPLPPDHCPTAVALR